MKPPKKEIQYEKVRTDDFVLGLIEDIEYDKSHEWKPYEGKTRDPSAAIRFKFAIDGCKFVHSTPWMSFSYGEKSKLYSKYLISLVEGAKPDMDFDLDQLKGLKVKMLWQDKGDFQHIETIRPADKKVIPVQGSNSIEEETVPF